MREYTIKIIIAAVALYILFKITIGAVLNSYISKIDTLTNESHRIEVKEKILSEMENATKKENFFSVKEKKIISNFLNKLKKELDLDSSK